MSLKKIVIATSNAGKMAEFKHYLNDYYSEILSLKDIGFFDEIIEDGDSFEANALIKARALRKAFPEYEVLADDSGLEVLAIDRAPGIYTARFAGVGASDDENMNKLLDELQNKTDRRAEFVCVLAWAGPNMKEQTFFGRVSGQILEQKTGDQGFGYDPLFMPDLQEFNPKRSFAQMSHAEKKSLSHRGNALKLMTQTFVK